MSSDTIISICFCVGCNDKMICFCIQIAYMESALKQNEEPIYVTDPFIICIKYDLQTKSDKESFLMA